MNTDRPSPRRQTTERDQLAEAIRALCADEITPHQTALDHARPIDDQREHTR